MHIIKKLNLKILLTYPKPLLLPLNECITGAKTLVDRLKHHGVDTVFGYPGGAILPVIDIFHGQDKIKYIPPKTELGGSFMAEGYAKATNKPGVIMVTSGPGAINIMTSLQNAKSDGTALIAFTGQVSTKVLGTDAFQEAPIIDISKPICKWNNMIVDGTKINETVDYAFKQSKYERHGPVLLDLPKNIMSSSFIQSSEKNKCIKKPDYPNTYKNYNSSRIVPESIIRLIKDSDRPVILAGQGILQSDSVNELREFSKLFNIPVTTTLLGLGVMDEKDELSLKMLGMHGSYYANMAIQNCDLLINFGSRFDDRIIGDPTKFAPKAKIVHIDILDENINKTIKVQYYINSDCKSVLQRVLDHEKYYKQYTKKSNDWLVQIKNWKKIDFSFPNKKILQGREVISKLNTLISKSAENFTIVADVGAHQMWAAQFIGYNYPKVKWITSGGLGSMGFALPASIGYKIGAPKDTVICICGDGGFTMSLIELLTAVENKVHIKVLIINNSSQLMVKMWQDKFYNKRYVGVKMNNPAFEDVVVSLGCASLRIDCKDKMEEQLKYFLEYDGDVPIVANVITDDNELVLPMVSPGKALDDMIIDENDDKKMEGDAPC
jgi:acetolactate synthase-1/2/3 large subunit